MLDPYVSKVSLTRIVGGVRGIDLVPCRAAVLESVQLDTHFEMARQVKAYFQNVGLNTIVAAETVHLISIPTMQRRALSSA